MLAQDAAAAAGDRGVPAGRVSGGWGDGAGEGDGLGIGAGGWGKGMGAGSGVDG